MEKNILKTNLYDCIKEHNPDVIILSGSLQYIEKPYSLIGKIINNKFDFIIIDRTPFMEGDKNRLTVQKVSPKICKASYHAWFFSETKFLESFFDNKEFEVLQKFNLSNINIISLEQFEDEELLKVKKERSRVKYGLLVPQ